MTKVNKKLEEKIREIVLDCFLTGEVERENPRGAEYGDPYYWIDQLLSLFTSETNREKLELIERIRIEMWRGATRDEAHRRLDLFKKEIEGEEHD